MVRFRVIRGSRLLLCAAVALLVLVILALALRATLPRRDQPSSAGNAAADEARTDGAEAQSAFAPSQSQGEGIEISVISVGDAAKENEHTDEAADEAVILPEAVPLPDGAGAPRVLIYHTHTHEAYQQTAENAYAAVEAWRTADREHSVVRVGQELADLLTDMGFSVIHDATDHEMSDLSTAYARSLDTLKGYDEAFDLYIDLHRDAYVEGQENIAAMADGKARARLMLLLGTGENFSDKPDFDENYAFAQAVTDAVNRMVPGLCRDVMVKKNRYNQHVGTPSVLVEAGNNKNTLEEALASMPYLAEAIRCVMLPNS